MSDFTAGLKEWREIAADIPDSELSCDLQIDNFAEGPGSILATGWLTCAAGCGVDWIGPEMWVSDDGTSWDRVAPISGLPRISGGSSGFMAITATSSVAISQDGRSWKKAAAVPIPAGASSVALDSAAAFHGGFILAGSIAYGHACAYALEGDKVEAGIWWSADGTSWTRDALNPSLTCTDADVRLSRLSDRAVLARESCYPDSTVVNVAWTSTDGRSWTQVTDADSINAYTFYTEGAANLGYFYEWGSGGYKGSIGQFCYFDDRLLPVALAQSGDVPQGRLQLALGPAGALATVDHADWIAPGDIWSLWTKTPWMSLLFFR